jgi:multisubunit Na+/H+ antiporter MnhG subunit
MMMINTTGSSRCEAMTREVLNIDSLALTPQQRAELHASFGVYVRSVIMLERTEAATSSRTWSIASMVIAAALLVVLNVPIQIILAMVIGAEVLGVVIGKASRRAVVKEIDETQRRLFEEVKSLQRKTSKFPAQNYQENDT